MRVPLLCLLLLASACGGCDTLPARPSPLPAAHPSTQPPTSLPRVIGVGEEVKDALVSHGSDRLFEVTVPCDGTLAARLTWDPKEGHLELKLADTRFTPTPPDLSPIVGKLPVAAGRSYRIRVTDGAPWDYNDLLLPFVLTTSLECGGWFL